MIDFPENKRCDCFPKDYTGHFPTDKVHKRMMIHSLYVAGFGYHMIADLANVSHKSVRDFIARGKDE